MDGSKIIPVDGALQELTQPENEDEMAEQLQVQANTQPGIPQDSSSVLVVEDLVLGHPWTTGLFDCREDQANAIKTAFLPCVTFAQIAEVLDEGRCTFGCGASIYCLLMLASYSQWLMSTEYRTKLRRKYNLEEEPYTDVAAHLFCPCCALCQEYRELQNRGLDPALGWKGIVAQRQGKEYEEDKQLTVAPRNQVMSKRS